MVKVHFMFFDAGGGHRSSATALREVIEDKIGWEPYEPAEGEPHAPKKRRKR